MIFLDVGLGVAIIGFGIGRIPNLALAGTITIIVGGAIVLFGGIA